MPHQFKLVLSIIIHANRNQEFRLIYKMDNDNKIVHQFLGHWLQGPYKPKKKHECKSREDNRAYLECWLNNIYIGINFAQFMLSKLCVDMLNNQINCNMIITSTGNNYISVLFWWQNKIIKSRLHKFCILLNKQEWHEFGLLKTSIACSNTRYSIVDNRWIQSKQKC